MKIKLLQLIILFCIIVSCKKESTTPVTPIVTTPAPIASFTVTSNEDGVATFTNTSKDADTFEWDFGDAKGKSTDKNPTYQFAKNGKYKVTLKVIGKGGSASSETETEIKLVQLAISEIDSRIEAFMTKYNIKGATLAISRNGKMMYTKGFGFGDVDKQEKVTLDSRFRIGSQSKTYCAVSIIKLIQDGKLKMEDKVFGEGAILGTQFGTKAYSDDFKTITVKHLLNHTAGSWGTSDNQGDIMGQVVNATNAEFFTHIIDNYPLVTKPGTRHSYANFGYFILARIVEKVSGKNYIDYLNEDVLKTVGLKNKMELTGRTLAELKTNEVKYYGQSAAETAFIYNLNIIRRDGSGGLISTATDMLRFINSIDGYSTYPDVLNTASITALTTPAGLQSDPSYACGTQINQGYWTHAGSINCQYGSWYRGPNQVNVVLNLNGRVDGANATLFRDFQTDFNNLILYPIQNVGTLKWQTFDLFN